MHFGSGFGSGLGIHFDFGSGLGIHFDFGSGFGGEPVPLARRTKPQWPGVSSCRLSGVRPPRLHEAEPRGRRSQGLPPRDSTVGEQARRRRRVTQRPPPQCLPPRPPSASGEAPSCRKFRSPPPAPLEPPPRRPCSIPHLSPVSPPPPQAVAAEGWAVVVLQRHARAMQGGVETVGWAGGGRRPWGLDRGCRLLGREDRGLQCTVTNWGK